VSDPRRGDVAASVRSPGNRTSGVAGFMAAERGTLCVRAVRLPRDFPQLLALLGTTTDDVAFTVCTDGKAPDSPCLARPAPVIVPPLFRRGEEIRRIISEYAQDAIAELDAPPGSFTAQDMVWVLEHSSSSFADIENGTMRLVALRTSRNLAHAAARLGLAPVSLTRWIGRRKLTLAPAGSLPAPRRPPEPREPLSWIEMRPPRLRLAEVWRRCVLEKLEEGQEDQEDSFMFGDGNIRVAAEEWLARAKSVLPSLWNRETISGLEALLAELPENPGTRKP
jgi:hypothetical protein